MKKIMNWFVISSFLFQSALAALGQGNEVNIKERAAKVYVEAFANAFAIAFHQSIEHYNNNIRTPQKIVNLLNNKEDRNYINGLLEQNKGVRLPPIEQKNGIYFMQFAEGTLKFDVVNAFENEIYFNNKKYKFDDKKDFTNQINDFADFLNKNANKTTSLFNFIIPEANAIICGGFCIAALLGGTIAAGYGVYRMAMGVVGEKKDAQFYKNVALKLVQTQKECENNSKLIEKYTVGHKEYYKATPGAFASFSIIKDAAKTSYGDLDKSKLAKHIMEKMGDKDLNSCQSLNKKIQDSMGPIAYRNLVISGKEINTCHDFDKLVSCLDEINEAHLSHKGKRNRDWKYYDSETGVYDPSQIYGPSSTGK
ncbi:MAG: hypothetical protein Fur0010_26170 [Bdellovibrio sp.]